MPADDRVSRRLKLRDLDVLMAVARMGSMGKASDQLNLSQPAVSKAIADLEQTLGVRLFDRGRHGVEPTAYGLALIKRGTAVFDELRHGVQDIEFLADPTAGTVRVGSAEPLGASLVTAVINRLSSKCPQMVFHVEPGPELLDKLVERKIELAVLHLFWPIAEKRMAAEVLFHDTFVIAAGTTNPWTRRRQVKLGDLIGERWVVLPEAHHTRSTVIEAFRAGGLEAPHGTVVTASLNVRNSLLATGRFLTVLPRVALAFPTSHPGIKALPVELRAMRAPVAIVTLKNRTLSPVAKLFIDTARAITKTFSTER